MRRRFIMAVLMAICAAPAVAQPPTSPVHRTFDLESVRSDFGLVDGAAASGNVLYVPDVKNKKLYRFRTQVKDQPWELASEDQGAFSGTFFQLGQLYVADNPGARVLKLRGRKLETWVEFEDGARPNDLVVDAHGTAYVTLTKQGEVRQITADGQVSVAASGIETPNGITLSPDGSRLYVSAYRPGQILEAEIRQGQVGSFREFARLEPGAKGALADGMCADRAGNVYCAGANDVWIWNADGTLLDRITTPERPINCVLGGQHGLDLYISTFGGLMRQRMRSYAIPPNPPMNGQLAEMDGRPSTAIPDDVEAHLDLVYCQVASRKLLCDVFSPRAAGIHPGIVLVHGGGWLHGDKNRFRALALRLAERGYAVMAIEYRLGHEAHFPAGIQDCNAATRFLKTHAQRFRVDATRIAAVGGSAGGHLVGLMATGSNVDALQPTGEILSGDHPQVAGSSELAAAVVMAGPTQIASGSVAERSHSGMVSNATQWLGKTIDEAPDVYHLADAYEKISADTPPLLFLTGSLDNPERDAPSLQKLKSVGVTARQVIHEGAKHGHWNRADWMPQVVDDIDAFLQDVLK